MPFNNPNLRRFLFAADKDKQKGTGVPATISPNTQLLNKSMSNMGIPQTPAVPKASSNGIPSLPGIAKLPKFGKIKNYLKKV